MSRTCMGGKRGGVRSVGRFVCFVVLGTAGMGTIGLAVLAEPLVVRHRDGELLRILEGQISDLEQLRTQQAELLANSNNPSVLERAAIDKLNYVPSNAPQAAEVVQVDWPELQAAIEKLDGQDAASVEPAGMEFIEKLAESPKTQSTLRVFGSVLVVISMTFFYRAV